MLIGTLLVANNSSISCNQANFYGGAIMALGISSSGSLRVVNNSRIDKNHASYYGGALFLKENLEGE
jgi:hypothetical protein